MRTAIHYVNKLNEEVGEYYIIKICIKLTYTQKNEKKTEK